MQDTGYSVSHGTSVNILDKEDGKKDADGGKYEIQIEVEAVYQSLGKKQLNEVDQVFND